MKIVAVRTYPLRNPGTGAGSGCWVELETDRGLMGIGIGSQIVGEKALYIAEDLLIGEDPRAVTAHWQRMCQQISAKGQHERHWHALAMLDMALWDLKAKNNHEPLWKTLGGARPRAFACASLKGLESGDDELRDWFATMAGTYGFRAGNLPVGLGREADLKRLQFMRDALAQNTLVPDLLISMDGSRTLEQAILQTRELEQKFDLAAIKVPLSAWGTDGLRQLSETIFAAVCASDLQASAEGLFTGLDHCGIDILTINTACSGITGALQVADAAYGFELPVLLAASPGNFAAHLAAVLPTIMFLEVESAGSRDSPITSDVRVEDGWVVAGDEPGHGIAIAAGAMEQCQ